MFIEFTGKNVKPQSSAAGGWPGVWEVGPARPFARRAGGMGRRRFDRNGAGARTLLRHGATLGPRPSVCCRSGCMAFGRWAQCVAACVFFF